MIDEAPVAVVPVQAVGSDSQVAAVFENVSSALALYIATTDAFCSIP